MPLTSGPQTYIPQTSRDSGFPRSGQKNRFEKLSVTPMERNNLVYFR